LSTVRYSALLAVNACLMATAMKAQHATSELSENVAGLRAKIEIIRDREGVPHVRAKNEPDAIFRLGFVHAQDRLWQLEYLWRLGSGRLALERMDTAQGSREIAAWHSRTARRTIFLHQPFRQRCAAVAHLRPRQSGQFPLDGGDGTVRPATQSALRRLHLRLAASRVSSHALYSTVDRRPRH